MVLGITGCPGSGKSVLAGILAEKGWILVDADEIGREVVEHNPDVLVELANVFGSDIINKDGRLDRRLLARRTFSQPEKTQILNNIVHPQLIECIKKRISYVRTGNDNGIVDCALIFEWGIEKFLDIVVCVSADEHFRKKNLKERDGRSSAEIEGLFSAQLPECEKIRKADIVITNNDSIEKMILYSEMLAELPRIYKGKKNG